MATMVRERPVYGEYGGAVLNPGYQERVGARSEPLVRPRERVAGRERVRVRAAGYVAPTAVIGFLLVGVMAILLLVSQVQLTVTSREVVKLKKQSTALNEENAKLLAEYELAFDLKSVEEQVTATGAMVQPQPGQIITLDMSEGDSAAVYTPVSGAEKARSLWDSFTGAVGNVVEFFK